MRRSAPSNATKPAENLIPTTGETFDDGAAIELVRGSAGSSKPNLLLWENGAVSAIGPTVEHRGRTYEAPEMPANLYRAVLLPSGCENGGSVRDLHDGITGIFQQVDFADSDSRLLAAFTMVTWRADRLPIAPVAEIPSLDQAAGIEALRLLHCLCRHPLLIAEVTPSSFRSLPLRLQLTLLMDQRQMKPALSRVLSASSHRGVHLPGSRGDVVDPYGPKAILLGSEGADSLCKGSIRIAMRPRQLQSPALDQDACKKISDHFQPKLLHFRLKHLSSGRNSPVDVPAFTTEIRLLASTLGACLSEDPECAREVIDLLRPQDDDARAERRYSVECAAIEVLWGLAHSGTEQLTVAALAKKANDLLRSRGEFLVYSAEELGWKLRALGISRHDSAAGRQVVLDGDTSRRVHVLARSYDLTCSRSVVEGCPECAPPETAVST